MTTTANQSVNAKWLRSIGGKPQEYGGGHLFFSKDDPRESLLVLDVTSESNLSLRLIAPDNGPQLHYWIGKRSREDMLTLFRILGVEVKKPE